jgi:hypothetical protein
VIEDAHFYKELMNHLDMTAGSWSKKAVKGLAGVAQQCHQYRSVERAAVRTVVPKLRALQASTGAAPHSSASTDHCSAPRSITEHVRSGLAAKAEYDETTQMPANVAAKKLVVLDWMSGAESSVVNLPFAELDHATHGFDEFNELGKGASCYVYKGHLFGQAVAVKKLNEGASEWGTQQFESECALLTKVTHGNICRLLAFSTDGPCRCLVMEFCTGGALEDRLACKAPNGHMKPAPLQWQHRVQIALDVGLALEHLHSLQPPQIHRDLKSANVLLDDRKST